MSYSRPPARLREHAFGSDDRNGENRPMFDLSLSHIMILGGILFAVFGARRFPEIGRSLGQGISNLYRGIKGAFDDEPSALPPAERDPKRLKR